MQQLEEDKVKNLDEIHISAIFAVIWQYKHLLLLITFFTTVLAAIAVFTVIRPTWEASAILQIGQVGQVGRAELKLVEPAAYVVTRMKHPSFARDALSQAKFSGFSSKEVLKLYQKSLRVTKPKDSDLIEFKLSGYSPEMARTLAEKSTSHLQAIHGDLMMKSIVRIKAQIKEVDTDIAITKKESESLSKQLQSTHNWDSYNATLSSIVLQDKANQLRVLVEKRFQLDEKLNLSQTFGTKIIGGIVVGDEPFPSKLLLISLAAFFGFILALFVIFIKHSSNQ